MSVNITYFFNSEATLPELSTLLNRILGCRFKPYQGNESDLFCHFLSLETSLGTTDHLVNDRDLDFESYRYELDTRTPAGDGDLREVQFGLMTMLPSLLELRGGITSGILVYEVQLLLARYEMREGKFFDALSNRPVTFPDHFDRVSQRLTRS